VYNWWDVIKYTIGLKFYDILAGRRSLGNSHFIGLKTTVIKLPTLNREGLIGGVVYHDGQFDDTRMLISLICSIKDHGGSVLNYCRVSGLLKNSAGKIHGVRVKNRDSDTGFELHAGLVINATGVFVDEVLRMDHPITKRTIRPSQGIHLVFDGSFLNSKSAIMIPKTDDGRVLFAIPWYDKVVAGTTDTPLDTINLEPKALEDEIAFILHTAGKYMTRQPEKADVLSMFAGLRPLAATHDDPSHTREISRRHKITISRSGLITVEGGKWTTYRRMAQDTINKAMRNGMLEKRPCVTHDLHLHGYNLNDKHDRLHIYGTHARDIHDLISERPEWGRTLHHRLPYTEAEIRWICRHEMPFKLEDMLARRIRALFLDAAASLEMAPDTAQIMAEELGFDEQWKRKETAEYTKLVENYICR
jgi:glycerol-3-phosphate dehydrogenase